MTPSRDHDVTETIHLTEQNFDEAMIATQGLVMVDFWAEWCGPGWNALSETVSRGNVLPPFEWPDRTRPRRRKGRGMRKATARALCAALGILWVMTTGPMPAMAQDAAGSSDHPGVARFRGSVIRAQTRDEFGAYTMPLGPPEASEKKFKKEQVVEGKVLKTLYEAPAGSTPLAVYRSYETALRQAGFDVLFTCAMKQCSPDGRIQATLGYSRTYLTPLGGKSLDDGGSYVLVARQPTNNIYVIVVASHIWNDPARGFFTVDVVEAKPLEAGLVNVKAEVLADDIKKSGHASVYGIYFDTGKALVKPESKPALDEIAKLLGLQPSLKLHVVGHTDNVGTLASNMTLSKQRADAVVNALVSERKIPPARLLANGVGPLAPVTTNDSDEGRAKNRRVELVAY